ncbi:MAG: DnaD domain protein [Acholeplasmataceae bacterium]
MILKRLYEEYDFSIERILLKEYRKLSLSMQELTVLIALFSIYKKRKTFSTLAISRRVEYHSNEIGEIVESLLDKGFLTISLDFKDQKEREVFDLTPTFDKIENLYIEEEAEKQKQIIENDVSQVILKFEQGLGRPLKSYELENIRKWFEEKTYTYDQILKAIDQAEEKVSIKYVERILTQEPIKKIEIDQDVEQALDEIFKSIK